MTTSTTPLETERNIAPFRGVSSSHGIDLQYTPSENYSLKIKAKARLSDQIETTVESGILSIRWRNKWTGFLKAKFLKHSAVTVCISAPALNEIDLSTGVDFYATKIHCDGVLTVNVSNGSGLEAGKVAAARILLRARQSSGITIGSLQAAAVEIVNTTHSDVGCQGIETDRLKLTASGCSDTRLSGLARQLCIDAKDNSGTHIRELKCEAKK